ncbi:MAG: ferritin family protein [Kiloniellales bacterium]
MAPLTRDPETALASLAELVGIACSIETEAVRRYDWLAAEMARRGEDETAETFRALAAEEGRHIDAVERWAQGLGEALPPTGTFAWRLPPDLARTWDEAAASALLTPVRALAIAVDNEQRAFAFYSYLAARADDPKLAAEAEILAREELHHAALLRTWRRTAWRREREGDTALRPPRRIDSREQLVEVIADYERAIALAHRGLARRLADLGDAASAALLAELAGLAEARAASVDGKVHPVKLRKVDTPQPLLLAAQGALERLSEILETLLAAPPDEATQTEAQAALAHVVARIARVGQRLEELDHA